MKSSARPKILAVGFHAPGTGFSRVMEKILGGVSGDWDCHWIGIGYKGPVLEGPFTLYPCNLEGGDVFGAYQARRMIEELRPAALFLLNDFWNLGRYGRVLGEALRGIPAVAYTPVDGEIPDPALVEPLRFLDRLVLYTEFGREQMERAATALRATESGFALGATEVVPHGVDTVTFRPLADKCEAKRWLFPEHPEMWSDDSFVVLNANRPHERKRIDLTVEAFSRFARGKPEGVRLYLHHAVMDEEERRSVLDLVARHGIEDRVTVSLPVAADERLTDEDLNRVYNACDVGVNTAMGEGWGLVSFEHAAAAAAQVVPRHSALTEIWEGAAVLLEPARRRIPRYSSLVHAEVSPVDAAAALDRLYADLPFRRQMAAAARRRATRREYTWPQIAARWRAIFDDLLQENERRVPVRSVSTMKGELQHV